MPSAEARRSKPGELERTREPSGAHAEHDVQLRLAIGKTGFGLELAHPVKLGCLRVTELVASLPGARFPLDVTGGVARFRHRRGSLQRVALELSARALEAWAAPRLRGLIAPRTPEVWIAPRRDGATIGVFDDADEATGPRALAFDVGLLADGGDLTFVVLHARGLGLPAPATALAILATQSLLGGTARRAGALFVVPNVASKLARSVFPDAGARAPAVEADVRWGKAAAHDDTWILHAWSGAPPSEPSTAVLRAYEAAKLLEAADDARVAGDLETARAHDVATLERAPRHPDVCRRIAEIDQLAGGRAEAALATLLEASREAATSDALLEAALWVESGDRAAAAAAYARAGETEPMPMLGASALGRAAEHVGDVVEASRWLDEAIARAPRSARLRWARVGRRLALGQLEEALGDVEHLEAQARGARAKYTVWRRAGEAWRAAGFRAHAAALFERALRFVPDSPDALAGLAASLLAIAGEPGKRDVLRGRGVQLLTRAVEIAARDGGTSHAFEIDLALALAEHVRDLPAAIARVRGIPHEAPEALVARGLEGRFRAALGDAAGATLAFARLRDLAAAQAEGGGALGDEMVISLLLEAAAFERDVQGDRAAAQRHLAVVLRLRPEHSVALEAYRSLGAPAAPPPVSLPPVRPTIPAPAPFPPPLLEAPEPEPFEEPRAAARAEELSQRLQLDPNNDAIVDELATLLQALGRGHELLALLSARLEEATPERRAALLPRTRDVLERLYAGAEATGDSLEASLFRDFLAALS